MENRTLIPENSLLRQPPKSFSRRQVLILDGIRYAIEMAHIAYERLVDHLQSIAGSSSEPRVRDSASAMLDAWAIVDSAHRLRDLLNHFPGLRNSEWKRLFLDRTNDVDELRDCVQHQRERTEEVLSNACQVWGYLSWAEVRSGKHTGKWLMMTAGSDYVGDHFMFIGPVELPFAVPLGRIRLNAFNKQVYLGRVVNAMIAAGCSLEKDIASGAVRPIGSPALERRGSDIVYEGWVEVCVSVTEAERKALADSQKPPLPSDPPTLPGKGESSAD